jgi:hypothetical protein
MFGRKRLSHSPDPANGLVTGRAAAHIRLFS